MKTITVDYEHNCERWWDAARAEAKGNPPSACVGLLDTTNSLTVPDADAAEFISWSSEIDGWNENPFVISAVGAGMETTPTGAKDDDL